MPKITNNILIASSSNSVPVTDTSYVLFVSGSNLYLASASYVQQLNLDTGYIRILEYTGSSARSTNTVYTYEVSPLVKMVTIAAVGAGGGGGGGARKDANTGTRAGGGGGAGAGLVVMTLLSQSLATSYTITVPGAPSGGLGGVTSNADGRTGQAGGSATVGSIIVAPGGPAGFGGTDDAFTTSPSTTATPGFGPYFTIGNEGGRVLINGTLAAGVIAPTGGKYQTAAYWRSAMSGIRGMAGGGAGGLITTAHATQGPTSGSSVNIYGRLIPAGSGGAAGTGQSAQPSPSNVLNAIHLFRISGSLLQCRYGVGAGGSGGASSATPGTPGGKGGDGGHFGAAGGGGGAGSGSAGGNGGSGSAGYVAILEFY